MRNATIKSGNRVGDIQIAMIWYDETDENELIQVAIGKYKYLFNNKGELQSTTGTISCSDANIVGMSCASRNDVTCIPNYISKSEE